MRDFLITRPVTVLGIISALHSIIYGLGYIIGTGGFQRSVLYSEIAAIMPVEAFGVVLLVVGLFAAFAYLKRKTRLISVSSTAQSFIWLFATMTYWINGEYLIGAGIALIWTMLSSYLAFVSTNLEEVKDRTLLTESQ